MTEQRIRVLVADDSAMQRMHLSQLIAEQPDMEIVDTYEGTDSIQSLIIGRDLTGISAFA